MVIKETLGYVNDPKMAYVIHNFLKHLIKNFENFFKARALRPVANDGEFCTSSCAWGLPRFFKYFLAISITKFQFMRQKSKNNFRGYVRNYLYHQ